MLRESLAMEDDAQYSRYLHIETMNAIIANKEKAYWADPTFINTWTCAQFQ